MDPLYEVNEEVPPETQFDADKYAWVIRNETEKLATDYDSYQKNLEAIELWWKQKGESRKAKITFMTNLIAAWMRQEKLKTYDGPYGKVSIRKAGGGLEVVSEEMLMDWIKKTGNEKMLRVKESLDKKAIMEYIKGTGELPPGADIVPETESVSFK